MRSVKRNLYSRFAHSSFSYSTTPSPVFSPSSPCHFFSFRHKSTPPRQSAVVTRTPATSTTSTRIAISRCSSSSHPIRTHHHDGFLSFTKKHPFGVPSSSFLKSSCCYFSSYCCRYATRVVLHSPDGQSRACATTSATRHTSTRRWKKKMTKEKTSWICYSAQKIARWWYGMLHPRPCSRSAASWIIDVYDMSHGHIFPNTIVYDIFRTHQAAVAAAASTPSTSTNTPALQGMMQDRHHHLHQNKSRNDGGQRKEGTEEATLDAKTEERVSPSCTPSEKTNMYTTAPPPPPPSSCFFSSTCMGRPSFMLEFYGSKDAFEEHLARTRGIVMVLFYTRVWGGDDEVEVEKEVVDPCPPSDFATQHTARSSGTTSTTASAAAGEGKAKEDHHPDHSRHHHHRKRRKPKLWGKWSAVVEKERLEQQEENLRQLRKIFSLPCGGGEGGGVSSNATQDGEGEELTLGKTSNDPSGIGKEPVTLPSPPPLFPPPLHFWCIDMYAAPGHTMLASLHDARETPMWVGYRDGCFIGQVEGAPPEALLTLLESLLLREESPTESQFE